MTEYICADLSERPGCKVSPFWERRERVVRCRDCVNSFSYFRSLCCGEFSSPDDGYYIVVGPDDFCSSGEPREKPDA